jgi:hypothetical protein
MLDLEPTFVHHTPRGFRRVDHIDQAVGILFLCPACWVVNNGPVGTHSILIYETGVPKEVMPLSDRWSMAGTSLDDLTLTPSIQLHGCCQWHGFVKNGQVTNA